MTLMQKDTEQVKTPASKSSFFITLKDVFWHLEMLPPPSTPALFRKWAVWSLPFPKASGKAMCDFVVTLYVGIG